MNLTVSKEEFKNFRWFITIVTVISLGAMWSWYLTSPADFSDSYGELATLTIEAIIAVFLILVVSKYQEKADDERKMMHPTVQTFNKVSGIFLSARIVLLIAFDILSFVMGIYFTFIVPDNLWFTGPALILVSLLLVYPICVDIAIARQRLRGRVY